MLTVDESGNSILNVKSGDVRGGGGGGSVGSISDRYPRCGYSLTVVGVAVVFSSVPGQGYQSPQCSNNTFYEQEVTVSPGTRVDLCSCLCGGGGRGAECVS